MSARGRCQDCWLANQRNNIIDLTHHRGPYFDHWRKQMAASVGGLLLDEISSAD